MERRKLVIKRRFRNRGIGKVIAMGLKDLSVSECYAIAYYLYCFSEVVIPLEEDGPYIEEVSLFLNLAERLNKMDLLPGLLSSAVKTAEKDGLLVPIPESEKKDDLIFEGSSIPFSYISDRETDRQIPSSINVNLVTINLYRCLLVMDQGYHFFSRMIANALLKKAPDKSVSLIEKIPAHIQKALSDTSKVRFITEALDLKPEEAKYLLLYYRCATIQQLKTLCKMLSYGAKTNFDTMILNISEREYNRMLRNNSALRAFGFVDEEGEILPDTIECISNQSIDVFFSDLLKEADCQNAYPLESFNVDFNAKNIMHQMISGPENISLLLYGKPGSGKTEFAKSLVAASGLKPLIFKNEAELERSAKTATGDNVICRLNLLLSIIQQDSVLIIDEADSLLRTRDYSLFGLSSPSKTKGTVNRMLEKGKNKIIWIVNFTSQIDESTLRRFNFSYKFDSMTREQIRSITNTKIQPLNLPENTSNEILSLMEKYSVTGASVDNVVKTIKSLGIMQNHENPKNLGGSTNSGNLNNPDFNKELVGCINTILRENSLLINGRPRMRETVSSKYDIHALNTSMSPEQIVRMIKNAQVFAEENSRCCQPGDTGIRMLFYGLSGTGKTEFYKLVFIYFRT